jgi:hypothetical protein
MCNFSTSYFEELLWSSVVSVGNAAANKTDKNEPLYPNAWANQCQILVVLN